MRLPSSTTAFSLDGAKRMPQIVDADQRFVFCEVASFPLQNNRLKKGLHVALLEMMLSLVVWGFLLGPWGGVLAVPLTLALRQFVHESLQKGTPIRAT